MYICIEKKESFARHHNCLSKSYTANDECLWVFLFLGGAEREWVRERLISLYWVWVWVWVSSVSSIHLVGRSVAHTPFPAQCVIYCCLHMINRTLFLRLMRWPWWWWWWWFCWLLLEYKLFCCPFSVLYVHILLPQFFISNCWQHQFYHYHKAFVVVVVATNIIIYISIFSYIAAITIAPAADTLRLRT